MERKMGAGMRTRTGIQISNIESKWVVGRTLLKLSGDEEAAPNKGMELSINYRD
jgi:hypothetical protein